MRRLYALLVVIVGKSISVGSLFLCGVLVARTTTVAEFGVYSAALTLILMLDSCLGTPLDYASVRFAALHADDEQRTARLQGAVFRLKLCIGVLLIALALGCGRGFAHWILHDSARYALIWIVAGSTSCLLLVRGAAAFLQSLRRFRDYALLDFASGAGRIVVVVALALLGVNHAEGYLAGFGSALLALVLGCALFLRQPYLTARWPESRDASAMKRFIGFIAGIVILGTITGRADLLFLSAQRGAEEVGHYAGALQLASALTLMATYVGLIVQPSLPTDVKQGRLARLLLQNVAVASVLAVMAMIATYFVGGTVLATLFGSSYGAAQSLLLILILGTSLDVLFMPVAMNFSLQFRPRASLCGELIIAAVFLAVAAPLAAKGALAVAWLVTGVRCAKTVLYFGIAVAHLRQPVSMRGAAIVS